ncbi:Alpha-mannosidase 2C1 [Lobulomyces angularis]|nr:Alpha-mannosidase 2C1 [Lobulomyces angularis]
MQKHRNITIERLDKFTSRDQFHDVNLYATLWKKNTKIENFTFFKPDDRIPFHEAVKNQFIPGTKSDLVMGPSWATYWINVVFEVPSDYKNEQVVLLFDPGCEALVYSKCGTPLQGITGGLGGDRHIEVLISNSVKGGEVIEFFLEVALNGMFGNPGGEAGIITAPLPNRTFKIETFQIAVPNVEAHHLLWDFEIIRGIAKDIASTSQIAADAIYTANKIVNTVKHDEPSTLIAGLEIAEKFFESRKEFGYADHIITATGHCHIDTAWLWPYDETKRKCARSWATQCGLMDRFPEYKFSCSQAQQFEWVEQIYPKLFDKIKKKVESGNFIPIGGTWVEMDCNVSITKFISLILFEVPSGESFCRQFLYGQNYFQKTFGKRSTVFWLPDTFGYSAQLPQIIKKSDLKYFFTQKLSWNNINKFPNTTFNWVGLDGTSVLTHFCPADTYCAQVTPKEVAFSVSNNKDKEYSDRSLLLFGNGDGGGGPLSSMIERLRRLQSIAGMPAKVKFGEPEEFYKELDSRSNNLVSWKGELYFELHRGTYTTHAKVKKFNRCSEYLLRKVEMLSSISVVTSKYAYPKKELDRLWKLVLLNQFHDVLPGSSIEMVYIDAWNFYEDVEKSGNKLVEHAIQSLSEKPGLTVFNSTSWNLPSSVIEVEPKLIEGNVIQTTSNGKGLVLLSELEELSFSSGTSLYNDLGKFKTLRVNEQNLKVDGQFVLVNNVSIKEYIVENQFITLTVDQHGRLTSLYDKQIGREAIPHGSHANVFKLYEDIPLYWDAWDVEIYHLEKGWDASLGSVRIKENGPLRVVLEVEAKITTTSTLVQSIIVNVSSPVVEFETIVNWKENRRMLKVEFPVDVSCDYATYETQFGYVQRPTHCNTSWDMAKFEVCGHKFVDLSEHGFGVALFNDCKYGHAVHENVIRMSLLRSPKAPDANCDIGLHNFNYAIYPHRGTFHESDVVQRAYQFNVPPVVIPSKVKNSGAIFKTESNQVVLDTIKISEDNSGLVLRFYESSGGKTKVKITSSLNLKEAFECNILEDLISKVEIVETNHFFLSFSAFEIKSLKILTH